jgi:cytochrome P450 family 6
VFFLAGFETSSTLLSFAFLELAVHPELQQRARQEIERVLQQHEGQLTYQALLDMKFVECIIDGKMTVA